MWKIVYGQLFFTTLWRSVENSKQSGGPTIGRQDVKILINPLATCNIVYKKVLPKTNE